MDRIGAKSSIQYIPLVHACFYALPPLPLAIRVPGCNHSKTHIPLQTRLSEVKQPVIPQSETIVWCEHNYCMMQKASICNSCLLHCRPLSLSQANKILHMTYGSSCNTQLDCLKWNNQLKIMQQFSQPCWALISSWLVGEWPLGFIKISEPSIPHSINSFHNV